MRNNFFYVKSLVLAGILSSSSLNFGDSVKSNVFEETKECATLSIPKRVEECYSSSLEQRVNYLNDVFQNAKKVFETARIPVLMFHNIYDREDRYTVSPDNFRRLLFELYSNDFYSVDLGSFYKGDFSGVPIGKKPLLLTFDDAGRGQFVMNSDGSICGNSAVGILEDFYSSYDFGRGGVMFVSYGIDNNFRLPFEQNEFASDKLKFLLDNGYDIGYHTVFHPNNTNASINNIFEQYFLSSAALYKLLGEDYFNKIDVTSYAHTFGAVPKNEEVFDYLCSLKDIIFDAWNGASAHPLSSRFDVYSVSRIETTYHTINNIINARNLYTVTPDTKMYYLFNNSYFFKNDFISMPSLRVNKLKTGEELSSPFIFF